MSSNHQRDYHWHSLYEHTVWSEHPKWGCVLHKNQLFWEFVVTWDWDWFFMTWGWFCCDITQDAPRFMIGIGKTYKNYPWNHEHDNAIYWCCWGFIHDLGIHHLPEVVVQRQGAMAVSHLLAVLAHRQLAVEAGNLCIRGRGVESENSYFSWHMEFQLLRKSLRKKKQVNLFLFPGIIFFRLTFCFLVVLQETVTAPESLVSGWWLRCDQPRCDVVSFGCCRRGTWSACLTRNVWLRTFGATYRFEGRPKNKTGWVLGGWETAGEHIWFLLGSELNGWDEKWMECGWDD